MTPFRSIAVAQTCPVKGDVSAKLAEHIRLIERAASEGAQVVVFPELSLTGYEIGLAAELAFSEEDPRLEPLADSAASGSIAVLAGAPVRIAGRLHIGAFVLFPDRTRTIYTKHRLGAFDERARRHGRVPPAEATAFHPGDRNPLVRFGVSTAAIAVCADTGDPAHPGRAADRGADAYLASMFVIPLHFDEEAAAMRRYAAEHSMVVALANYGSPTGGLEASGRSSVWLPSGELLVQLGSTGPGVAIAAETPDGWRAAAIDDARVASRAR